jgi:hypothetical protein
MKAAEGRASAAELRILRDELGSYSLANAPDEAMQRAERRLRALAQRQGSIPGADREDRAAATKASVATAEAKPPRGLGVPPPASTTPPRSTRDDVAAAVEAGAARGAAHGTEKGVRAASAAEQKRLDKILDAAEKTAAARGELLGGVPGTRAGMRRAALRGVPGTLAELKKAAGARGGGLTADDVKRMQFEFLTSLHGIIGQFGSNLFPADASRDLAQQTTQLWAQTHLLREQNELMRAGALGLRFPATEYARQELAAAGYGVGF